MASAFPARLTALEPFWGYWYLDELLGEGSYGKVYRIRRKEFDKVYYAALKWVPVPQNEQEPIKHMRAGEDEASTRAYYRDIVSLLHNELVLMSTLRGNSFIVSYEDHMVAERKDSIGYDVLMRMELLTPLPDLVGKGLKVKDVMALGLDLCSALMLCEQANIVHRDIKPDNIFKSEFGNYKLGDFGVARQLEKTQGAMSRKGTPHYMAPELMVGAESGKSVDQYSLGLVLHNLLNGNRIPFVDVSSRLPSMTERDEAFRRRMTGEPIPPPILGSEQLKAVVCKAAAYKAEDRYPDAKSFREALLNCQADLADETPLNTALMEGTAQQKGAKRKPDSAPDADSTVGLYDTDSTLWAVENKAAIPASTSSFVTTGLPLPSPSDIAAAAGTPPKSDATSTTSSRPRSRRLVLVALIGMLVAVLGVIAFIIKMSGAPAPAPTPPPTVQGVTEKPEQPAASGENQAEETGGEVLIGESRGFGGVIRVAVAREDGKMTKVVVVEHSETAGISDPALQQMPGRIVSANNVDVDTVTGATITSNAIRYAVRAALASTQPDVRRLLTFQPGFLQLERDSGKASTLHRGDVNLQDLTGDEHFWHAIRISNRGDKAVDFTLTYRINDGPEEAFGDRTLEAQKTVNYYNDVALEAGKSTIIWYINGHEAATFTGTVHAKPAQPDVRSLLTLQPGILQFEKDSGKASSLHTGDVNLEDLTGNEHYWHAIDISNPGEQAVNFTLTYRINEGPVEEFGDTTLEAQKAVRYYISTALEPGTSAIIWYINGYEAAIFTGTVTTPETATGKDVRSLLTLEPGFLQLEENADKPARLRTGDVSEEELEGGERYWLAVRITNPGDTAVEFQLTYRVNEGPVQVFGDKKLEAQSTVNYYSGITVEPGTWHITWYVNGYKATAFTGTIHTRSGEAKQIGSGTHGDFEYLLFRDGVEEYAVISKYTGTEAALDIPATLLDKPVREIGEEAFSQNETLTSVRVPNGVTRLGDSSFFGCDLLTSVQLPDSITSIGSQAFDYCNKLANINLPKELREIDVNPFGGIPNLQLTIPADHPYFLLQDDLLIERSSMTAIAMLNGNRTTYSIPEGIRAIGNAAFVGRASLTSVHIPDSVSSIYAHAFLYNEALTTIILPDGLTEIGNWAFAYCSALKSIHIPDSVQTISGNPFVGIPGLKLSISSNHPYFKLQDGLLIEQASMTAVAMLDDGTRTSYDIPEDIITIGHSAFACNDSLTSIRIPDGVTGLKHRAFGFCQNLETVYIPASVTSFASSAFGDSPALTLHVVPGSYAEQFAQDNNLRYTTQ